MYRFGFRSANLLEVSVVSAAAMLAICLLTLAEATNTAEASSLPQNGKIAFTRNGAIYTVEPDGSNLSQLTSSTSLDRPVWSPDGTKIAFSQIREGITFRSSAVSGISVMSADGSNLRDLHTSKTNGSLLPAWLPDGTKVAFTGIEAPPPYTFDIYMMNADGSNLVNLTKTREHSENWPAFSPNGSQMCFSREGGIYVMNVDESDPTLLVEGVDDTPQGCNWSPDGTRIAFEYISEVYVINADGSARTALTSKLAEDRSAADTEPDWSPDGTRITFASDRDGDFDIYTMDADGSDVAQVTNSPGGDFSPDWQPLPRPTSPQSRSVTVHPPDTGGPSLLLVGSALLFSACVIFHTVVQRRM